MRLVPHLIFLFYSLLGVGQAPIVSQIDIGNFDMCRTIIPTNDGGFAMIGQTTFSTFQDLDILLIKISQKGDTLWTKVYKTDSIETGYDLVQTKDLGFMLIGHAIESSSGLSNMVFIRTDDRGNKLWTTKLPGGQGPNWGTGLVHAVNGGFVFTGQMGDSIGSWDMTLGRIDESGKLLWQHVYNSPDASSAKDVINTKDGGYLICGNKWNGTSLKYDVHLIKTNEIGQVEWSRSYGGKQTDGATAVRQVEDGYVVVGNSSSFGSGNSEMYLLKIDALGDTIWTRTYGGKGYETATDVLENIHGEYIITGYGESFDTLNGTNAYLLKVSNRGDSLWVQTFGGPEIDYSNSICFANDSSLRMTGTTFNVPVGRGSDVLYIEAIDPDNPPKEPITSLSLFPNPNDGSFTILSYSEVKSLDVVNTEGKVVYKYDPKNKGSNTLKVDDTPTLTQGAYFARIRISGAVHTIPFVVNL